MEDQSFHEGLVPDFLANLQTYQAGKPIDELAREKGLTRISKLASNENPLGPSPRAIREMTNGLWDLHRYPDQSAFRVKSALAQLYQLKKENIILGNGSEGILAYITRIFLRPGYNVLTSANSFIGFKILAQAAGAKVNEIPLTHDYRYDVHALAKKIGTETKLIYIANPNNPTGTYITKDDFDHLMKFVPPHVLVILDEAYFEFAIGQGDYPDSMNYRYDNVITLRTFSKAYGISGIRVGYGFAHEVLIKHLHKAKLTFSPNTIAQLGAYGALKDRNHLKITLKNNKKRIDTTFKFLNDHGFITIPSVCNFLTFKTGSPEASDWLCESLLEEGVIVRNLKVNEMPEFVRVSMGLKKEMDHFYEAMNKLMPAFNKKFRS